MKEETHCNVACCTTVAHNLVHMVNEYTVTIDSSLDFLSTFNLDQLLVLS